MRTILTHILYLSALSSIVYGQGLVWEPASDLSVPRHEVAATLGKDGRIYAIGGWVGPGNLLKSVEAFDEGSQTWIPNALPDLPVPRSSARAVTDSQGKIWVIGGGTTGSVILDTVVVYDPAHPAAGWQIQSVKLNAPRCYMGAVIDRFDNIYIFGGADAHGVTNTAEKYETGTGQWTSIASMHQPKYGIGYSMDGQGRIYAISGSNGIIDFATAERYDPATNTWERLQKSGSYEVLDYPHASCVSFFLNGKIWYVGGWNGGMLSDTGVYDPVADTWQRDSSQYPYLYEGRAGAAAVISKTGWVYIIGGQAWEGTATSHVARMRTVLPVDCTKILYETDFSADPGWITDQPENFYWASAAQAYHFRGSNTEPVPYAPMNRYYGTELPLGIGSFVVEWDLYLTRLDWSAGFTFGLFDETRQMFGGQNVWADFASVDRGLITTLYVFGAEGQDGGSSSGGIVELNRRYSCRIAYDAPTRQVHYEIRIRRTGELVWSVSVSVPGGFTNNLKFLGGTREGVRPPYTGVNPSALSEGMIDNVKITVNADPSLLSPKGGERWISGTKQTIEWSACPSLTQVRLEFSSDAGQTWSPIGVVFNTGKFPWEVPSVNSDQCRIRVSHPNNPGQSAVSEEVFTVFTCKRKLLGDLNGDCYTNLLDLAILAEEWLRCGNPLDPACFPYTIDNGLLAHYKLDETSGPVKDETGNFDATNNGAIPGGLGITGNAYVFDGVSSFLDTIPAGQVPSEITVSMWAYLTPLMNPPDNCPSDHIWGTIENASGGKNGFYAGYSPDALSLVFGYYSNNEHRNVAFTANNKLSLNNWVFLAFTVDGANNAKIFINGVEEASAVFSEKPTAHDRALMIGKAMRSTVQNYVLEGRIDDVRIYDRALTNTEVKTLYQNP